MQDGRMSRVTAVRKTLCCHNWQLSDTWQCVRPDIVDSFNLAHTHCSTHQHQVLNDLTVVVHFLRRGCAQCVHALHVDVQPTRRVRKKESMCEWDMVQKGPACGCKQVVAQLWSGRCAVMTIEQSISHIDCRTTSLQSNIRSVQLHH
jgi:hypothetical protein